jgi:hypothetical protein
MVGAMFVQIYTWSMKQEMAAFKMIVRKVKFIILRSMELVSNAQSIHTLSSFLTNVWQTIVTPKAI